MDSNVFLCVFWQADDNLNDFCFCFSGRVSSFFISFVTMVRSVRVGRFIVLEGVDSISWEVPWSVAALRSDLLKLWSRSRDACGTPAWFYCRCCVLHEPVKLLFRLCCSWTRIKLWCSKPPCHHSDLHVPLILTADWRRWWCFKESEL